MKKNNYFKNSNDILKNYYKNLDKSLNNNSKLDIFSNTDISIVKSNNYNNELFEFNNDFTKNKKNKIYNKSCLKNKFNGIKYKNININLNKLNNKYTSKVNMTIKNINNTSKCEKLINKNLKSNNKNIAVNNKINKCKLFTIKDKTDQNILKTNFKNNKYLLYKDNKINVNSKLKQCIELIKCIKNIHCRYVHKVAFNNIKLLYYNNNLSNISKKSRNLDDTITFRNEINKEINKSNYKNYILTNLNKEIQDTSNINFDEINSKYNTNNKTKIILNNSFISIENYDDKELINKDDSTISIDEKKKLLFDNVVEINTINKNKNGYVYLIEKLIEVVNILKINDISDLIYNQTYNKVLNYLKIIDINKNLIDYSSNNFHIFSEYYYDILNKHNNKYFKNLKIKNKVYLSYYNYIEKYIKFSSDNRYINDTNKSVNEHTYIFNDSFNIENNCSEEVCFNWLDYINKLENDLDLEILYFKKQNTDIIKLRKNVKQIIIYLLETVNKEESLFNENLKKFNTFEFNQKCLNCFIESEDINNNLDSNTQKHNVLVYDKYKYMYNSYFCNIILPLLGVLIKDLNYINKLIQFYNIEIDKKFIFNNLNDIVDYCNINYSFNNIYNSYILNLIKNTNNIKEISLENYSYLLNTFFENE